MTGWTPALRIARRELMRSRARTLLVLLMVLLPVTAVVALSTLLRTSELSVAERLPDALGSAEARLDVQGGVVRQDPLLENVGIYDQAGRPTPAQVKQALPDGARLLEVREDGAPVALDVGDRRFRVSRVGIDLTDPSTYGPFSVVEGRAPRQADEVAVTPDLVAAGVSLGSTVELGGQSRTVTGSVSSTSDYASSRSLYGVPAAVGMADDAPARYWVSGAPVTWADVQELNALGVGVLSRTVVLDPPDVAVPEDLGLRDDRAVTLAIVGLIAAMAVLEVVLLAGPAFAVGARRQRRALALLAASGGEPAHVRRVVLAQGLLVGLVAAAAGAPLGIAVAALARAPLTRWADAQWGPFEVSWLDVLLVVLLGAGTALLAALVPAVVMARQPVLAALQGRRLASAGAARPALMGLVLLGIGILLTLNAVKSTGPFGGYAELGVAFAAVPTVLGAVLLAPAALSALGRVAGRLPMPLRFAVRDADRQRGRTAPAVAAIAATVAGVVALGTAGSSDAAENRLNHQSSGAVGTAVITSYAPDVEWDRIATAARGALPGQDLKRVRGITPPSYDRSGYTDVQVCRIEEQQLDGRCFDTAGEYSSSLGAELLVGPEALTLLESELRAGAPPAARAALAAGQVLVSGPVAPGERLVLRLTRHAVGADGQEQHEVLREVTAPSAPLEVSQGVAPARAVLPESVAVQLVAPTTVSLVVDGAVSERAESELRRAVRRVDDGVNVLVERGWSAGGERTALIVLALVAGVLVLAGTLAATSLALSEARPDLTTLGQVGARPRTRRAVAGSYALVIGLVGAVLGIAAGLIPGIAAAVPLTRSYGSTAVLNDASVGERGYVLDIPFWLLGLVLVVLPLISAAVAAASVRPGRVVARREVA